jgi:hypothetical protein
MHKVTILVKLRIPTLQDPHATCPCPDRRPLLAREIAGRDFKEHETLASGTPNAEPRRPIDFSSPHQCSRVISRATPPRLDGPRDFGFLLDNSKSSILFLLKSSYASPPLSCMSSPGVCSHHDTKVFFQTCSCTVYKELSLLNFVSL